jgi:hypothetical protein
VAYFLNMFIPVKLQVQFSKSLPNLLLVHFTVFFGHSAEAKKEPV